MYEVTITNDDINTVIHSPHFNVLKLPDGQVKKKINQADGFTFSILPNNPGYNLIRPLKTLVTVVNKLTNQTEFDGRVLSPTEDMSASGIFGKTFLCEGVLGLLNDSVQRHGEYHDITVKDFLQVIINNHNKDVEDDEVDKQIRLGEVDVDSSTGTLYRYLGYESTFDAIEDKLIGRLGGEIRIRNIDGVRYLDYSQQFGELKSTEIRLSKNLQSISREIDPTEIITRLIPLGETIESDDEDATDASQARLTIERVNDGKDYIDDTQAMSVFGVIARSETWDDIAQPGILKTRGSQFLKENNRVKVKHNIGALDLSIINLDTDSFDLYNTYPVINPVMGIDENLRVIGKDIDINNPENNNLEFGDHFKTASEYQNEARKAERMVTKLENTVERQSKRVSELSKASKEALEEIEELRRLIDEIDSENIDESLDLIVQQLVDISGIIEGIGKEIVDVEERVDTFEEWKEAQGIVNNIIDEFIDEQKLINADVKERLSVLEGDET